MAINHVFAPLLGEDESLKNKTEIVNYLLELRISKQTKEIKNGINIMFFLKARLG